MNSLFKTICLMLAGVSVLALRVQGDEQPPNIVLLVSDDDDYEHFGFMGDEIARTPTLDALAKSGTLFTMAHCPAPLCRPSLASLLSGKLPHQHGIYANYLQTKGVGNDKLKLNPTGSLANRLKDAGYATYATSKYWEGDPRTMGFTQGTVDTTFKGFQKFVRSDQDELDQFIDQQGPDKPMFIWWAPLLPHKPHNPPAKYLDQFADVEITIPPFYKGNRDKYTNALRKFYAMGTWFDDGVSDLIDKLKAAGEYDNTVFLFYVDNGYAFGIPAKNSPTEKGLRTPMFVSWPGKPGRIPSQRIDDLSYALDLHATALDYAGIEPPADIASRSLRPRIEGKQATAKETIFGAVYAHAPANYSGDPSVERSAERDVYALYARTKRWKYVLYTQDVTDQNDRYIWMVHEMSAAFRREQGDENLFDLDADPYEQADLATLPERRTLVSKLRSQVLDWWTTTGGKSLDVESKFLAAKERPAANLKSGQATRLPNVIFMLTDDLGYSDVGCYGAQKVKTPHIDRLATEGVRFTDFHTAASICSPSRAAFLTGAYPQRAGLYMGINPNRTAHWFLGMHPDEITIAEQFQQQGYATHMVGKWHLGTEPEFLPRTQGFDHYYGMRCNYNHSPKFFDDGEEVFAKSPLNRLTQLYTNRVTSIIRDQAKRGEPFFLYYAHNYPHTPYEAGAAFQGTSQDRVRGDVMQELDWGVGEMMAALKEAGIEDNTIVIFTSDNGPTANEYAKPYRGTKFVTFEGGHRVPFIFHWPSRIKEPFVSDVSINAMDVFPTLSAVIGADLPDDRVYDGENLLPLFDGDPLRRPAAQPFYYYNCENLQAIRCGPWKLHLPRSPEQLPFWDKNKAFGKLPAPVLYNLHTDEAESTDVAPDNPGIVRELARLADAVRANLGEYMQRGKSQRPTGSLFPNGPVISHEKDWGTVGPALAQSIARERQNRHPNQNNEKAKPRRKNPD